ncbi:MAG TPA: hypothetical protein VG820_01195 [Fimbriimonadaceae bacterium]|nr:hypothetical protein [Fimbriimonadaceae bacterium]
MPILPLFGPGPAIFDQSLAAFRARKAFVVRIGLDAKMNGVVTTARYRLSYESPNRVLLAKLSNGRANMVFWLDGARFIAYDPSAGEMVVRKAPASGPIVNRVANSIGGLEDPVAAQLDPKTMAAFLEPFRALKGWTSRTASGKVFLGHVAGSGSNKTYTQFDFSASTKLLTRAVLTGPTSRLEWDFDYEPTPRRLSFSPPRGTKKVNALTEHITEVATTDPKARKVVDASLRAYSRLDSIAFSVASSGGSSKDWMNGSSFRESRARLSWSYDKGILTILNGANGKNYRGKCGRRAIAGYVRKCGSSIDPLLLALINNRNPISGWFLPGMKVSNRGTVRIGSQDADAIELRSLEFDVSLLVRRDNHLVASVTSRTRDKSGAQIAEASRDFTYTSVNRPLPRSTFILKASSFKPLSALGS